MESRFAEIAKENLDHAAQMDASLARRRARGASGTETGKQLTDTQKMHVQYLIDARSLREACPRDVSEEDDQMMRLVRPAESWL